MGTLDIKPGTGEKPAPTPTTADREERVIDALLAASLAPKVPVNLVFSGIPPQTYHVNNDEGAFLFRKPGTKVWVKLEIANIVEVTAVEVTRGVGASLLNNALPRRPAQVVQRSQEKPATTSGVVKEDTSPKRKPRFIEPTPPTPLPILRPAEGTLPAVPSGVAKPGARPSLSDAKMANGSPKKIKLSQGGAPHHSNGHGPSASRKGHAPPPLGSTPLFKGAEWRGRHLDLEEDEDNDDDAGSKKGARPTSAPPERDDEQERIRDSKVPMWVQQIIPCTESGSTVKIKFVHGLELTGTLLFNHTQGTGVLVNADLEIDMSFDFLEVETLEVIQLASKMPAPGTHRKKRSSN